TNSFAALTLTSKRPPERALIRSASALAAVPGPGRLRGQEVTIVHCCKPWDSAGVAKAPAVAVAAAPVAAMLALVKNLRRSIGIPPADGRVIFAKNSLPGPY